MSLSPRIYCLILTHPNTTQPYIQRCMLKINPHVLSSPYQNNLYRAIFLNSSNDFGMETKLGI